MFLWYSTCSRPQSTAHSTAQGLRGVELAHQLLGGRAAPPGLELVHIHEPPRRDIRATNPGRGIGAKEIDIIITGSLKPWGTRNHWFSWSMVMVKIRLCG